jgi:hypothetical protein
VADDDAEPEPGEDSDDSPSLAFLRDLARAPERTPIVVGPRDEPASAPFVSTRFELRRRLGAGGFGVVYEAFDRERGATVALKTLRRRDEGALARFKREFRALCELSHENLVQLYELCAEGETWLFTMELLRGESALSYVRKAPDGDGPSFDEEKLRDVLHQLAAGLSFLHRAGKLHRDVKPENVMVTREGRVVLLDFGLVTDIAEGPREGAIVGTPAYMAPEQIAGLSVGTAADWYAVGVMLYQALTGKLPRLPGEARDPARPSAIAAGVPADLDGLAMALLSRAPERRPSGRDVRALLESKPRARRGSREAPARPPFIGRRMELAALREAFAAASTGDRPVVALVHGRSGAGKTALCRRFLHDLTQSAPARLVLAGRCFEQESVPYKAIDGLVDALCHRLLALPAAELAAIVPPDIATLARLFPVLRQLPGAASGGEPIAEAAPLRRRAFAAFSALLARVDPCPTLAIDDLQWGDLDSIALLLDLLGAGRPLFVLASYRTEEAATSPVLAALTAGLGDRAIVRSIEVAELDDVDAESLSRALLEAEGRSGDLRAEAAVRAIVAEARGNPFLITEIARHHPLRARGETQDSVSGGAAAIDPAALLASRIDRLPAPAKRLLEIVAIAGEPVPRAIAKRAAFDGDPEPPELSALGQLRAERLVRVQRTHDREELFAYHDRVREAVRDRLPDEVRRACHERLALALSAAGDPEAERLYEHFRKADRRADAARWAERAAAQASAALAFDRAARLYREALDLSPPDDPAARSLQAALGDALTAAGRPREAALAYLAAARGAPLDEGLAWRRRAVEHLLGAGYIEEGLDALRGVLRDLDLDLPASRPRSLLRVVAHRVRARLPRAPADPRAAARADICYAAALGLVAFDPVVAADFQGRQLRFAAESGDPYRAARARLIEAIFTTIRSPQDEAELARALAEPRAIAARLDEPHLAALALMVEGFAAISWGGWRRARACLVEAESILRARCRGVWWEIDQARYQCAVTLWMLGELDEFAALVRALLVEAKDRGNRHVETMLRVLAVPLVELSADRPDRARAAILAARGERTIVPGTIPHTRAIVGSLRVALYAGDARGALAEIDAALPSLIKSGILLSPVFRAELRFLRALAAVSTGDVDRAAADARALARAPMTWARGSRATVEAAIARRRGDVTAAIAALARVEEITAENGVAVIGLAARRRRGLLMADAQGRAIAAEAEAAMRARGVANPERMTALLLGDV